MFGLSTRHCLDVFDKPQERTRNDDGRDDRRTRWFSRDVSQLNTGALARTLGVFTLGMVLVACRRSPAPPLVQHLPARIFYLPPMVETPLDEIERQHDELPQYPMPLDTPEIPPPPVRRGLPKLGNRPRGEWPLPQYGVSREDCRTPTNELGTRCIGDDCKSHDCYNPCPRGKEADPSWSDCHRKCRKDADCDEGRCSNGLCDSVLRAEAPCQFNINAPCKTAGGNNGFLCKPGGRCYPFCTKGLSLFYGTDCAKPCRTNADCPGGSCSDLTGEGSCAPVCPSEGCPTPWGE